MVCGLKASQLAMHCMIMWSYIGIDYRGRAEANMLFKNWFVPLFHFFSFLEEDIELSSSSSIDQVKTCIGV